MKARRWLSILLALVMVIGMLPVSALAADDVTEPEAPAVCTHESVTDYVCDACQNCVPPEADSTLTAAQATALGLAMGDAYTEGKYYVTGTVAAVSSATFGNMTIRDAAGDSLYIYGTYSADGSVRYDALEVQPVAGDTVTLYGVIGCYGGKAQMKNSFIMEHSVAEEQCTHPIIVDYVCENCGVFVFPEADSNLTANEANVLGQVLEGSYTADKYYVTGTVESIDHATYGNMYIKDAEGNTFYVYGTYSADGTTRYDALEVKPVVGDTVTVYGIIGSFNGGSQMKNGWITEHIVYENDCKHAMVEGFLCQECGFAVPPRADTTLSLIEANQLGLALGGGETDGMYYVTGTVVDGINTTYGNMTIEDAEGNSFYLYGLYDADGSHRYDSMYDRPIPGSVITVYGKIGSHKGTAQMKNGCVQENVPPMMSVGGSYTFPYTSEELSSSLRFTAEKDGMYVFYTFTDIQAGETTRVTDSEGNINGKHSFRGHMVDDRYTYATYINATAGETYTVHYSNALCQGTISVYLAERQLAQNLELDEEYQVQIGGAKGIQLTNLSALSIDDYYVWESSDESVVTLSYYEGGHYVGERLNATFHGVGVGTATITVTGYPSGQSVSAPVTVLPADYTMSLDDRFSMEMPVSVTKSFAFTAPADGEYLFYYNNIWALNSWTSNGVNGWDYETRDWKGITVNLTAGQVVVFEIHNNTSEYASFEVGMTSVRELTEDDDFSLEAVTWKCYTGFGYKLRMMMEPGLVLPADAVWTSGDQSVMILETGYRDGVCFYCANEGMADISLQVGTRTCTVAFIPVVYSEAEMELDQSYLTVPIDCGQTVRYSFTPEESGTYTLLMEGLSGGYSFGMQGSDGTVMYPEHGTRGDYRLVQMELTGGVTYRFGLGHESAYHVKTAKLSIHKTVPLSEATVTIGGSTEEYVAEMGERVELWVTYDPIYTEITGYVDWTMEHQGLNSLSNVDLNGWEGVARMTVESYGSLILTATIPNLVGESITVSRTITAPLPPALTLGEKASVTTVQDGWVYYSFTPEVSCEYLFRSYGNWDTVGRVVRVSDGYPVECDDWNNSPNFGVGMWMDAGETYLLGARLHSWEADATFDVAIEHGGVGELTEMGRQNATCTTEGYIDYRCNTCDYEWREILPAHHHFEGGICTECGEEEYYQGTSGSITWNLSGRTGVLNIGGVGAMPDYYAGNAPWYNLFGIVKSIAVGSGITYIGENAFYNCSNATSVSLSSALTAIGDNAFEGCRRLESITLPEGLTALGYKAFAYSGLKSLTLPASLTEMEGNPVIGCEKLEGVYVADGSTTFKSVDGVLYSTDGTVLRAVPWNVTEFDIPDGVTTVGEGAFYDCRNLVSVTIPEGVTTLELDAFLCCDKLTEVTLPSTLTYIGESAFRGTGLTEIVIPEGVTEISHRAFAETDLAYLIIPAGVQVIGGEFLRESGVECVIFEGSKPALDIWATNGYYSNIWYPANDASWDGIENENYGGNPTWNVMQGPVLLQCSRNAVTYVGAQVTLWAELYYTTDTVTYHWYYQDENYDWVEIENEVSNSLTFTAAENNPTQYLLEVIDENGDVNNVHFDVTLTEVLRPGSSVSVNVDANSDTSVLIVVEEGSAFTLNTVEATGGMGYNLWVNDVATGNGFGNHNGAMILPAGEYTLNVWNTDSVEGTITIAMNEVSTLALGETVTGVLYGDTYQHYLIKPEVDTIVTVALNGGDGYSFWDCTEDYNFSGEMCNLQGGHVYLFSFRTYEGSAKYTLTMRPPMALTAGETAEVQIPNGTEYWFTFTPETDGFIVRNINTASGSYSHGSLHTNDGERAEDWGWGLYYVHKDVTYRFYVGNWSGDTTTAWVSIHMAKDLALGESYDVTLAQRGEKTLFAFTPETDGFYVLEHGEGFWSEAILVQETGSTYVEGLTFAGKSVYPLKAGESYFLRVNNNTGETQSGTVSLDTVDTAQVGESLSLTFAMEESKFFHVTVEEDGFYTMALPDCDGGYDIHVWDGNMEHVEYRYDREAGYVTFGMMAGESYVIRLINKIWEELTWEFCLTESPLPEYMEVEYSNRLVTDNTVGGRVYFGPGYSGEAYTVTSSNPEVVQVCEIRGYEFTYVGKSAGTAELTVTTKSGLEQTFTVTVKDPLTLTLGETTDVYLNGGNGTTVWLYSAEAGRYLLTMPEAFRIENMSCGEEYLYVETETIKDGVRYCYVELSQANARYVIYMHNRYSDDLNGQVAAYRCTAPTAILAPESVDSVVDLHKPIDVSFPNVWEEGTVEWEIISGREYGYISGNYFNGRSIDVYGYSAGEMVLQATCGDVTATVTVTISEVQDLPEDGAEVTLNAQSDYAFHFTAPATGWYSVTDPGEGVSVEAGDVRVQTNSATGEKMYFFFGKEGDTQTIYLQNTTGESVSYTLAPTLCGTPESAVIVPTFEDGQEMGFTVEFEPFGSYADGEWGCTGEVEYMGWNDSEQIFYCYGFGTVTFTWDGGEVTRDVICWEFRPYLSMGWLDDWGDGLFYNGNSGSYFGFSAYWGERGVWLLNTCDPETREWTVTPIGMEELTWDSGLTMMPLHETGEPIMEGAEYADKYVYLTASDSAVPGSRYDISYQMGDTTVTTSVYIHYNNGTYHSEAQPSRENWLRSEFTIDPDAEENVFYFVQDNPAWAIEYFMDENGGEYVSIEQLDERTLKITVLENKAFHLNLRVGSETTGWERNAVMMVSLPPVPVEMGQMHTVTVMDSEFTWMTFTPEVSCNYVFMSYSDGIDPAGVITDMDGNWLAESDDYEGLNFYMEAYLEAGVTYMLGARAYTGGVVSYEVMVSHARGGNVTELELVEPTCEADGYVTYECADCGHVWTEVLPGGHRFEDGWCTVCGEEEIYSGTCGENVHWELFGVTGVLEIFGTGAMEGFYNSDAPWYAYRELIRTVVVEEGVTTIGEQAFEGCYNVEEVILPKGLTTIETAAFFACHNLRTLVVPSSAELTILDGAFADNGIRTLIFEGSAPTFAEGAFVENLGMTVYYPANDPTWTEDVMQNYGAYEGVEIVWQAISAPLILNPGVGTFGVIGYETKLTVEAYSVTGEMTYLWQCSDDDGESWTNLSDTDNVLNLIASAADANRMYRCVVSDALGSTVSDSVGVMLVEILDEGTFVKVPAYAGGNDFAAYAFIPEETGRYYIHSDTPFESDGWYDLATLDLEGVEMDDFGPAYLLEAGQIYLIALGYTKQAYSAMIRKEGKLNVGSETMIENMPVQQVYSLSVSVEEDGAYVLRSPFGYNFALVDAEGNMVEAFGGQYTESYAWAYVALEAGDYILYMACSGLESTNESLLFAQAKPADSFEVPESVIMTVEGGTSINAKPTDPMTFIAEWKWEIVEGADVAEIQWENPGEVGLYAKKAGTAVLKITGDGMVKTVTITVEEPKQIKLGASETVTVGVSGQVAYSLEITEPGLYSVVYPVDLSWDVRGPYDEAYTYETDDLACVVFHAVEAGTYSVILTNYENAAVQGAVSVMKPGAPTGGKIYEDYSYNEFTALRLAFDPVGSYANVEWTVDNEDMAYIDAIAGNWCMVRVMDRTAIITVTATWEGGSAEYVIGAPEEPEPPEAPVVSGSTNDDGYPVISWTAVDGAEEYILYRSDAAESGYWELNRTTETALTNAAYTEIGNTYYYKVSAVVNGVEGPMSDYVAITRVKPTPKAPVISGSTNDEGYPVISWTAVDGAEKYILYRSDAAESGYWELNTTTGTSLTNAAYTEIGNTYYYKVSAVVDGVEGPMSDYVAITRVEVVEPEPELPAAPVISGTTNDEGYPVISWTAVDGAEKYILYRSDAAESGYWELNSTTGTSLTNAAYTEIGNTYYYKVSAVVNGVESPMSDYVAITRVKPAETAAITKQPVDITAVEGTEIVLSITATGDGLTYQWYAAGFGSDEFVVADGFVASEATLKMAPELDGVRFYCVVTDQYGNSVQSDTITLTMKIPLVIFNQPDDVTVAKGEQFTITVEARGKNQTYTWYYALAGSDTFVKDTETVGTTVTLTMTEELDGARFYCIVTDEYGVSLQSDTATVTMQRPAVITKQPADVIVAAGEQFTLTVEATGDKLVYQWYMAEPGSDDFLMQEDRESASWTLTMTEAMDGARFYCIVIDFYGNIVKSDVATLSMVKKIPAPVISGTTNDEGYPVISWTAVDGAEKYILYRADSANSAFYYWNELTETTTVNALYTEVGNTYYYKVSAVVDGVEGPMSEAVAITRVKPAETVAITKQPVDVTAEKGEQITISITATGDGLTYTWYYAPAGSDEFIQDVGFVGHIATPQMSESLDGVRYYCVVTDQYGNSVQSNTITLTMEVPEPVIQAPVVSGSTNDEGYPVISWTAVDGAEQYILYRSESAASGYWELNRTTGTSLSNALYTQVGGTYYYKVSAVVNGVEGPMSDYVAITRVEIAPEEPELPKAPVVSGATNEDGYPVISWTAVDGAEQYILYRSESAASGYWELNRTSGTSLTNAAYTEVGNTYYYKVSAVVNGVESPMSDYVAITRVEIAPEEPELPKAPVVSGSTNDEGYPVISWTAVDGAEKYRLYRSDYSATSGFWYLNETNGTSLTNAAYTEVGGTYYYKVSAVVNGVEGPMSEAVAITRMDTTPEEPELPKAPVVSGATNDEGYPVISWTAVAGAEKYLLYRSDYSATSGFWYLNETTGTSLTNAAYTEVGGTYYYKVSAVVNGVEGPMSEAVVITREDPTPKVPVLSGSTNADGYPVVSWEPVAGAEKYLLYRSDNADSGFWYLNETTGTSLSNAVYTEVGGTYYYKVSAVINGVEGAMSEAVAITRVDPTSNVPVLSGSTNDEGYPVISWTAVAGAEKYLLYRSDNADSGFWYLNETTGTSLSNAVYTEVGGTYYYKVSAVIGGVEGPMSEAVAITRIAPAQ